MRTVCACETLNNILLHETRATDSFRIFNDYALYFSLGRLVDTNHFFLQSIEDTFRGGRFIGGRCFIHVFAAAGNLGGVAYNHSTIREYRFTCGRGFNRPYTFQCMTFDFFRILFSECYLGYGWR